MQFQHQVVRGIAQRNQLQAGLQEQASNRLERSDLAQRERIAFRRIEGFDKGPLDSGHIDGEAMTAAGVPG